MATLLEATPDCDRCLPVAEVLPPEAVPVLTAFENRLKAVTPYFPVTVVVLALNVLVFVLMALMYERALHFNPDILVRWGAGHGIKTFAGEWWRPFTSTFLHTGLGHLTGNLFFLLMIAPIVERLLGPARFAIVYLFAGIGAALLGLGWYPTLPGCGASGAVFGLYGAFLGCYLRSVWTIPARIFLRSIGLLLVYTLVTVLCDYLESKMAFIVHLGGFVFGFAGGLFFGHVLGPRNNWQKLLVFSFVTTVCCSLLVLTAWWMQNCSRQTCTLLATYDSTFDRQRQLVARFDDALDQWDDGSLTTAGLQRQLQVEMIPEWERFRAKLKLPDNFGLENRPLSVRELLEEIQRSQPPPSKEKEKQPISLKEFDTMFRLYLKLRMDNWRALADALQSDSPKVMLILVDEVVITGLRHELNEMANDQNPLGRWPKSARQRRHEKK